MSNPDSLSPFFTRSPYRTYRALQRADRSLGFPRDQTFMEFEGSTITIPIRTTDLNTGLVVEETLRLAAFMRLEVYPAYVNQQGTREFQFIIRDWELYNQSRALTRMFMDSFDGREVFPTNLSVPPSRQTAAITFSLSKKYIKYYDPRDENLAPAEVIQPPAKPNGRRFVNDAAPLLDVKHMANEWNHHNDLVWQVQDHPVHSGKYLVNFYRLPFEQGRTYDPRADFFNLVAQAGADLGVAPDGDFTATGFGDRDNPPRTNRPEPLEITWKLGSRPNPDPAKRVGVLHQVAPPQSFCVADQAPARGEPVDSADFPARITYAASYDVWLNNFQLLSDQAGVAMARNVAAIPPRDVLVAFEKPFSGEFPDPKTGHMIRIEFGSGTCTGMVEITRDEWFRGRELALGAQATALFLP